MRIITLFYIFFAIKLLPQTTYSPENAWVEIYLMAKSNSNPNGTTGFTMEAVSTIWDGGNEPGTNDYSHSYTWISNEYNSLYYEALNDDEIHSGWDFVRSKDFNVPIYGYGKYKLSVNQNDYIYLDYRDDRCGFYSEMNLNPEGHHIDVWIKYDRDNSRFYICTKPYDYSWEYVLNGTTKKIWDIKGVGPPSTSRFKPYSPENLTNTIVYNKPKLVWQHHSPAEDYWIGYEIYRCITTTGTNPTNFSFLSTVSKYTTNYIDYALNLNGNQTAYYKVKTKNTSALSEFSNQTSFSLNPPPAAPQNLDVTSNGTHPIVTWDENEEPDLNGYYIYKSVENGDFYQTSTLNANTTSWIDYDVTFTKPIWSVKIEYKAKAFDTQGNISQYSNSDYIYGKDNPLPKINFQDSLNLTHSKFPNFLSNYPNPFNPTTTINYQLPKDNHVTLKVYDMLGKEITTLVNEYKSSGAYSVKFDGSRLSNGVYFYRIEAGNFNDTKKLILMK